ncbi:hypothetical protein [Schumannella sp. 10F1B-5-1]|uniref:hypothetical protein n=1 Tax=Schumannella sp. 10F1B-5-1 TaxID=2590780 RepID=UPI00113179DE|nr:hypothetical protein [Schumannella sp. 10F1B-5-1]TPW76923.1 hypothetical protein FJ658_03080 [Schumannella sp. 10F1B-5-1]
MTDPRDDSSPAEPAAPAEQRVRIRRAPKLSVFMGLGAIVGVLVSLILTSTQKADPSVGFAATAGYFAIYGVTLGVLVGAIVGLIADRVSRRRAHYVVVEHEVVDLPDEADEEPALDATAASATPTSAEIEPGTQADPASGTEPAADSGDEPRSR